MEKPSLPGRLAAQAPARHFAPTAPVTKE